MKIAIVVDQYDNTTNGTTVTSRRFAERLRQQGHEVRVVSVGGKSEPYRVSERWIPLATLFAHMQGMRFAKPDSKVLREAFEGVDIVHLMLPFALERKAEKIARSMQLPILSAFHLQAEDITYNIGMKRWDGLARFIYRYFNARFYRRFEHIHCPTQFMADELRKNGYKQQLHVISNGVDEAFHSLPDLCRPDDYRGKFVVMMIGRLSVEKNQEVLMRAIARCGHAENIRLVLAGCGPKEKAYKKLAHKLNLDVSFGFYSKEDLVRLINCADLYVHASDIESEAIACMEAFACGVVPLIADSKKSATPYFAIDERSLFHAGDAGDLANKLDYWIDHPAERAEMSAQYAKKAEEFRVSISVQKIETLYQTLIEENRALCADKNRHIHKVWIGLKPNVDVCNPYKPVLAIKRVMYAIFYQFAVIVLSLFNFIVFDLEIEGQKHLRGLKGGYITVSNHMHILDCSMLSTAMYPKTVIHTSMEGNFRLPFIRWLVKWLGAVPIPSSLRGMKSFLDQTAEKVKSGAVVNFYPEGSLWPYCDYLRPFKKGAFHAAALAGAPVVPMVIVQRPSEGGRLAFRRKPFLTVRIGRPLYPDNTLPFPARVSELRLRAFNVMEELMYNQPRPADYPAPEPASDAQPAEFHFLRA